jgi:hypothetical protein
MWPDIEQLFNRFRNVSDDSALKDTFLEKIDIAVTKFGLDYISVIKGLESSDSATGTAWLQGIVDDISRQLLEIVPSFK